MRKIYKLKFNGRVHFGENSLDSSAFVFSNNRLFSALWIEALGLNTDPDFLKNLKISDVFPYIGDEYYLPKPIVAFESSENIEESRLKAKRLKSVKYIAASKMSGYLRGEDARHQKFGEFSKDTKVSISRDGKNDTKPYSVGVFQFDKNCGLYFIVDGDEVDIASLELVLSSLQFSGIGGKRSSGFGSFSFKIESGMSLNVEITRERKLLLSSAFAAAKELGDSLEDAMYLLNRSSGWINETIVRKNDVYIFSPGSTFKNEFSGEVFSVGNETNEALNYAKAVWMEI